MRTKEEFEQWYQREDPWMTEKSIHDKHAQLVILNTLRESYFTSCLDIGCGEGSFTNKLAHSLKHMKIDAIDISEIAIQRAKRKYPHITFLAGNFIEYHFSKKYDLIICKEMIYFFSEQEREIVIEKIYELSNDNSLLVITSQITGGQYLTYDSFITLVNKKFNIINIKVLSSYPTLLSRSLEILGKIVNKMKLYTLFISLIEAGVISKKLISKIAFFAIKR